jgi:membrane-bound serine protease (ClpP class)
VKDLEELFARLNVKPVEKVVVEPTGAEKLARWINAIAPILLMIGIAGIYIEYKTPGFGIFGTLGVLAFLVYFFGGYVAGLSGIEWLVVFFLGIVLIAIELFVFPGTIFIGLGGFALVLLSLVMSGVDMYPDMPAVPSVEAIGVPMQNLIVAVLGGILICYLLGKWLPHSSYYGRVVSQGASGMKAVPCR